MLSKPSYLSEESDSKILRGYYGSGKFTIRPKLYLGSGPVPRISCAEDEWSKAEVSRGTAEDYPILGTSGLQREEQRLDEFCPQIAPWRGCEWNGAHVEVRCKIGSRKIRPLHQRPDHINEKRRLGGVNFDHHNWQKVRRDSWWDGYRSKHLPDQQVEGWDQPRRAISCQG